MFFSFFPLKVRLPYHFECLVVKISMSSWNLSFEELEIFDHLEGKKMFIIFVYVYIYIFIYIFKRTFCIIWILHGIQVAFGSLSSTYHSLSFLIPAK